MSREANLIFLWSTTGALFVWWAASNSEHTLKKSLKGQRRTGAGADAALKAPWPAGDRFEASSFD